MMAVKSISCFPSRALFHVQIAVSAAMMDDIVDLGDCSQIPSTQRPFDGVCEFGMDFLDTSPAAYSAPAPTRVVGRGQGCRVARDHYLHQCSLLPHNCKRFGDRIGPSPRC